MHTRSLNEVIPTRTDHPRTHEEGITMAVHIHHSHPPECTMGEEDPIQTHQDSKHTYQQDSQLTGYDNQGEI